MVQAFCSGAGGGGGGRQRTPRDGEGSQGWSEIQGWGQNSGVEEQAQGWGGTQEWRSGPEAG